MKTIAFLILSVVMAACGLDTPAASSGAIEDMQQTQQGLCVLGGCDEFGCWPDVGCGGGTGGGAGSGTATYCNAVHCVDDSDCQNKGACNANAFCSSTQSGGSNYRCFNG